MLIATFSNASSLLLMSIIPTAILRATPPRDRSHAQPQASMARTHPLRDERPVVALSPSTEILLLTERIPCGAIRWRSTIPIHANG
jgi:hypothetical protein